MLVSSFILKINVPQKPLQRSTCSQARMPPSRCRACAVPPGSDLARVSEAAAGVHGNGPSLQARSVWPSMLLDSEKVYVK